MRLFTFNKEKTESSMKSEKIKVIILVLAPFIGLILSIILAYKHIDFSKLLEIISNNIFNPEIVIESSEVMIKWYITSGVLVFAALIFPLCIHQKNNDELTWKQCICLAIELILIYQMALPLLSILLYIVIALVYLLFFSSMLIKNIIAYGTYIFVLLAEKICQSSGITLTYGQFIGQDKYSQFLTIITFLISIPYILPISLRMIRKFIEVATKNKIVVKFFEPIEKLININVLRYIMYILLFFISIYTYSLNITQTCNIFLLIKESFLEFVLLDTVISSIICSAKNAIENKRRQKFRKCYIPFKYDLEAVLSEIMVCNLKNKEISARIIFSMDINEIIKEKRKKDVNEIDNLLIDISKNYYKIEVLEQKSKETLSKIINTI